MFPNFRDKRHTRSGGKCVKPDKDFCPVANRLFNVFPVPDGLNEGVENQAIQHRDNCGVHGSYRDFGGDS